MPPPAAAPTSPKAMRRAHSFSSLGAAAKAASPRQQNENLPGRRASATDGDVLMGNTFEQPPPTTASSTTPTAVTGPTKEQPIPRLRSIAPAFFVPVSKILPSSEEALQRSLSLATTDRAEHMRQALSRSDKHAAAVRGNLLALFRRENARLLQSMRADEQAFQRDIHDEREDYEQHLAQRKGWSASPADLDRMIASMAAPAPPAPPPLDPHAQVAQILQGKGGAFASKRDDVIGDVPEPSFAHRAAASPRELAAREGLMLVSKATTELRGYDAHIAAKRDMRRRALDRESAQRRKVTREVE
ncbi:uncharacterized protein LMH87_009017 [Akanthomyces muscarius]|uniref:Uncharacterized protein n=1 Tax=Akanthomyces muscarius TaxID=2231603 RepID=A0A9W8QJU4_AKAMU|nr:uncharacterized protein LMH87_009017 [Akanthomyces muscarius]KAJ4158494.1 hypothetical protein LMH87_009017 [Akanthomyces muscarius]